MLMRKPIESLFAAGLHAALAPLVFALCGLIPAECGAQEAAVLSKRSGLYLETFLAFEKAFGSPVRAFDISAGKPLLPQDLKAVVAFGSKATAFEYPVKTKVIYLLSPGFRVKNTGGRFTKISVLPEASQAIAAYKKLQPGLKRLAVLFKKPEPGHYISELAAAAKRRGLEIIPVGMNGPGEFPDKLRGLAGKIDAFWLLPEPALINSTSLMVLAEFSCSNKLPFYAPSGGLTELGAAASFAPNSTETGVTAAWALEKALAGETLPGDIYIPRSEITINESFIVKCGLPVKLPRAGVAQ